MQSANTLTCRDLLIPAALRLLLGEHKMDSFRNKDLIGLNYIYYWSKFEAREVLPGIILFHNNLIPTKVGPGWTPV